ncbi:MAG TPA: hypothetical protein VFB58_18970 [Chloroflexota bacterium]|nr:hypothetical protein [Chloroflexota bacterium]
MRVLRILFLSLLLCGAALTGRVSAASSRHAPTLTVHPTAIRVGHSFHLQASHLSPKRYYILLFVPLSNRAQQRFLPIQRSSSRGTISTTLSVPRTGHCGNAVIDLLSGHSIVARATLRIVGCGSGRGVVPPPPPSTPGH